MERLINDFRDGETYLFANSADEYEAFTDWLCTNNGARFAYHFESGECFRLPEGKYVEVYGSD